MPAPSFHDVPDEHFLRLLQAIKDHRQFQTGIVLRARPVRGIARRRQLTPVRR